MNVTDLAANIQSKIQLDDNGCWVWTGAISRGGYGQVRIFGRTRSTHRVAYELLVGPIPEGLQIDHLCRVKACCNPAHLEPVTGHENTQRRPDVNKEFCVHGHALTPDNVLVQKRANGNRSRNCRTCHKRWQEESRANNPRTLPAIDPRHGTANGYRSYGCRCEPCTTANREAVRAFRARKSA